MSKKKSHKAGANGQVDGRKVIASNRRAFHDYHIDEEFEAGIELTGTEIKSLREGRMNIRDAYARIDHGELWLIGMHISPYEHAGTFFQHDPVRPRRLLLHKSQIRYLQREIEARGYTLIPLRIALKRGWAKVDLGLARGKKLYDKRDAMAERDAQRDVERALRERG
jgi:SsrA-binding protein